MRKMKKLLTGFLCFLIASSFSVGIGALVFFLVKDQATWIIILSMVLVTLMTSLFFTIFDYFRRKIMIDRPLNDILTACEKMAKGDFSIELVSSHSYQDFDEFDLIKEDLNKMSKELSRNEVLKNDFISNVSHEIKTPLSSISNYVTILSNDSLTKEEKKNCLNQIHISLDRLTSLVSNILKLNKLENQKLEPEFTRFNLSETLIENIVSFETLMEKKKISLDCNIEEDLYIYSQQNYLEIIFNNLLSNAVKFTNEKGNIFISLKKEDKDYIFTIKDDGCGMDKETGRRIFDKFYQGDTSHSNEGNGLGLALVKKVIDLIGGSIKVESKLNEGTTFIAKLKEINNER